MFRRGEFFNHIDVLIPGSTHTLLGEENELQEGECGKLEGFAGNISDVLENAGSEKLESTPKRI